MSNLAATVWGSPTASKRAILFHGLTASSQTFFRVAEGLVAAGYHVTAPELLGHGSARRGTDYTIAGLAEEVRPFFTETPGYDLVIGHSLGGLVALAILPLLGSRPTRMVLVDPPLYQSQELVDEKTVYFSDEVTNVRSLEKYQSANPRWTRADAAWKVLGAEMCEAETVQAIFKQNVPWDFGHLLGTVPPNVNLTVQGADPSLKPCFRVEEAAEYPHVKTQVIWGSTHSITRESPEVIVEAALAT
ncbi:alpha/beta-hydrolase [Leucogyrophana mollusca]|uniref:Alpha/beta-hydrolase n=1 Tax=Leucogyrophana mollusca TaxID=85980 RepID=A0ACB8BU12_9AGAM|nr:alpha/beta-hydrolase [Leucogyrophana mollusca]